MQVVETWSQWAASGLLQHTSFRQQSVQALQLLAEALHKPTDRPRLVSSDGLGLPSLLHFGASSIALCMLSLDLVSFRN